jgi:hypothetical protein
MAIPFFFFQDNRLHKMWHEQAEQSLPTSRLNTQDNKSGQEYLLMKVKDLPSYFTNILF